MLLLLGADTVKRVCVCVRTCLGWGGGGVEVGGGAVAEDQQRKWVAAEVKRSPRSAGFTPGAASGVSVCLNQQ